ncbi:SWIM zinc finger family protein [Effusibacillus consociatus]|uniref:SWIM zinc finger domain-containing protein n=1 Tax=Effusibacillus consociatus TaxID=1117041 RepID=A0ABV9PXH0_9BACL
MKQSVLLTSLISGMDRFIPDPIIDRGISYFEQGLVENVQIRKPWIHATVLGNYGDYNVKIHLSDFSKSRCDCPYDGYCKHMAAVVYFIREDAEQLDAIENAYEPVEKTEPGSKEPDDLEQQLKDLERQHLLEILQELVAADPTVRESIRQLLIDRERTSKLNADQIRHLGLYSSIAYYQKEVPLVLKDCEDLFTRIETSSDDDDDRWDYEYYHDDEDRLEWDFEAGLNRLHRFAQELLKLVTPDHYISGTVGLLVTLKGMEDWINKYEDEYSSELSDGFTVIEDYLWEALKRIKKYRDTNPKAEEFLHELIEWIVRECKTLDGLLGWTSILTHCVPTLRQLWVLKERIMLLDKEFFNSPRFQEERHRRILVHWWVELCLSLNQEQEAQQAAEVLGGSDAHDFSVACSFVKHYERNENWPKAIAGLQVIIEKHPHLNEPYYEWMINLCQRAGDETGKRTWYEKWFLAFPDFELFKRNVELLDLESEKQKKISQWLDYIRTQKKDGSLVISMLLFVGDKEQAWAEFTRQKNRIHMNEALRLKLFKEMKQYDPAKLIPVYRELAQQYIGHRNRSGYTQAARWMKDLKEVCSISGKHDEWNTFYRQIMTEYHRFRSLMEEIRLAGLETI